MPTVTVWELFLCKSLSGRLLTKSAYEKELMGLVLAVQHWRPYLLGRRFIVRTNQRSLRHLLSQPLTTPAQQNWAAKLLGNDFTIMYKEGVLNKAADVLSRREEEGELAALTLPRWVDWTQLQDNVRADPNLSLIITDLEKGQPAPKHYSLVHGTLFYKGRLVIPSMSDWIPKLLIEFNSTPTGGHSGAFRTYRRLAANVYWPGMMRRVTQFVTACEVFQRNKYDTKSPVGLLSPLPISSNVWEDISLDFTTGLSRSGGVDCVLVVVDRFSKCGHFLSLRHPFTAKTVADLFTRDIVCLHGTPSSIVSDRDPIFLSLFW